MKYLVFIQHIESEPGCTMTLVNDGTIFNYRFTYKGRQVLHPVFDLDEEVEQLLAENLLHQLGMTHLIGVLQF